MAAVRGALEVFSGDDRYHWPMKQLFGQLTTGRRARPRHAARDCRQAVCLADEETCTEMIHMRRFRRKTQSPRAPYFRLGLETKSNPIAETCHPGQARRAQSRDPENPPSDKTQLPPSKFETRLAALDDVLTHPGKHAARMARALYRADNEASQDRSPSKAKTIYLIDNINAMIAAHEAGDADTFAKHYELVHPHIPVDDTS